MTSEIKTRKQLIDEITALQNRVSQLGVLEKGLKQDQQSFSERVGRFFPQTDHPSEAVYVIFDRKLEFVNDHFARLFEIEPEEACHPNFRPMKLVAPESRRLVRDINNKGIFGEYSFQQYEFTGLTKNGIKFECETFVMYIPYRWGVAIHGMLRDISAQKRIIEELQRNRSDYQIVLDSIPTTIFYMDRNHRFIRLNKAFCKFLGMTHDEIIGKTFSQLFPNLPHEQLAGFYHTNDQVMASGNAKRGIIDAFPSVRTRRWIQNDRIPYRDDSGNIIGVICLAMDVSNLLETEEKLSYMSLHDVLTGLYNRSYFQEELNRLGKSRLFPVSIAAICVDNLVAVNQEHGIAAGNEALRQTARALKVFRTEDVVARIGGNKFAAIMPASDRSVEERVMDRLRGAIEKMNQKYRDIPLEISIGIVTLEKNGRLSEALKNAETAMKKIA